MAGALISAGVNSIHYGQPQSTSYAVHVGQNIAAVGSAMTQKNV